MNIAFCLRNSRDVVPRDIVRRKFMIALTILLLFVSSTNAASAEAAFVGGCGFGRGATAERLLHDATATRTLEKADRNSALLRFHKKGSQSVRVSPSRPGMSLFASDGQWCRSRSRSENENDDGSQAQQRQNPQSLAQMSSRREDEALNSVHTPIVSRRHAIVASLLPCIAALTVTTTTGAQPSNAQESSATGSAAAVDPLEAFGEQLSTDSLVHAGKWPVSAVSPLPPALPIKANGGGGDSSSIGGIPEPTPPGETIFEAIEKAKKEKQIQPRTHG